MTPFTAQAPQCDGSIARRYAVADLDKGVKQHGISLFTMFVSALGLALGKFCHSRDVTLCLIMNIRFSNAALNKTLGMLVDRFPVRLRWNEDETLQSFLKRTHEVLEAIQNHQTCSGRKWMKDAAPEIDHDALPIMNLNYRRGIDAPIFQGLDSRFPRPTTSPEPRAWS